MPDLDLLPRRPFAVLPPEPGGFEAALARGRRRRRRNTSGGMLASVIALALAVSLTGGSPDADARLEFTEIPPAELTDDRVRPYPAEAQDEVTVEDLADVAQVEEDGRNSDGLDSPGSRTAGDDDVTAGTAVRRSDSGARTAAAPGRRVKAPAENDEPQGYLPCTTGTTASPLRVDEWCLAAAFRVTDDTDGDAAVTLKACLSPNVTSTRRLSFATEQQVDFVVRRAGRDEVVWQWAHRAMFYPGATQDYVQPGGCHVYEVEWLGRGDNAGNHVPTGNYELTAISLASELGETNSTTIAFELD